MTWDSATQPAAVYRHINAAGETLYIGCSRDPDARFSNHRCKSAWARQVVRIDLHWFDDRKDALREEARLIQAERPIMNKLRRSRGGYRIRRSNGPQILAAWLLRTKVELGRLAHAMNISKAQAANLLNESARPRLLMKHRLAAATSGFVPPCAWCIYRPVPADWRPSDEEAAEFLEDTRGKFARWGKECPDPIPIPIPHPDAAE